MAPPAGKLKLEFLIIPFIPSLNPSMSRKVQGNVPAKIALPSDLVAGVGPGSSRKPPKGAAAQPRSPCRFELRAAALAAQTCSNPPAVDRARSSV
jgi:hypothetical protein